MDQEWNNELESNMRAALAKRADLQQQWDALTAEQQTDAANYSLYRKLDDAGAVFAVKGAGWLAVALHEIDNLRHQLTTERAKLFEPSSTQKPPANS